MADKNTANIGFEKQIWDAACVLRGNLDASEYKSVVLGLIFLKYISDRFEDKYYSCRYYQKRNSIGTVSDCGSGKYRTVTAVL